MNSYNSPKNEEEEFLFILKENTPPDKREERCRDCICLTECETGLFCDEVQKPILDIEDCPEAE